MFAPSPPSLFHRAAHPFPKKYACWLFSASCQQTCGAICVAICSFRNLVIWRWRRGSSLSLLCVCVCVSFQEPPVPPFLLNWQEQTVLSAGWIRAQTSWRQAAFLNTCHFYYRHDKRKRKKRGQGKRTWVRKVGRHDEERIREYRDSRWERAPDATGEHCWASHHLRWERFSA